MIIDPAAARVAADLKDADFLNGCEAGYWCILPSEFPILNFMISSTEPNGSISEYGFRAELSNFPSVAPLVKIWDHANNCLLPKELRPKGDQRVQKTFQNWGCATIYRAWDRETGPHNNNARDTPHLAWRSDRHLLFIFEDLHGILNSNARAQRLRTVA